MYGYFHRETVVSAIYGFESYLEVFEKDLQKVRATITIVT